MMPPPSYIQCMKDHFLGFFIYYPLVLFMLFFPLYFIHGGREADLFGVMAIVFSSKNIELYAKLLVLSYFGQVTYSWSYQRSPRYKRRQEELERWQAEKALKASGYVAPKPDLTTYLQDMRADKLAKRLPLEVVLTKELEEYWQASGIEQTFAAWATAQWEEVCRAKQDSP